MKQIERKIAMSMAAFLLTVLCWHIAVLEVNISEKIEKVNAALAQHDARTRFINEHLPLVADYTSSEMTGRHILRAVYDSSLENDLPADLILSVIQVESSFNPKARSNAGAIGLMQIMPGTGIDVGRTLGYVIESKDELYDIEKNIAIGTSFLKECIERLGKKSGLGYYYAGSHTRYYNRYARKIAAAQEFWRAGGSAATVNM